MSDYLIHDSTLEDIADAIRSKTGGSALIDPEDMADEIESIPSGGGVSITDGIVVKSRNANGRGTSVDFYGTEVPMQQFTNRVRSDGAWIALQSVTFKNTVTAIRDNAFYGCGVLNDIDLSTVETLGNNVFQDDISLPVANLTSLTSMGSSAFIGCTALRTVFAPLLRNCSVSTGLRGCTSLETVQLGSVGYGVTALANNLFQMVTQTGLTITIYTTGNVADLILQNARNGATNATIIIKASEETTYNGTTYSAGDTILTSEVS